MLAFLSSFWEPKLKYLWLYNEHFFFLSHLSRPYIVIRRSKMTFMNSFKTLYFLFLLWNKKNNTYILSLIDFFLSFCSLISFLTKTIMESDRQTYDWTYFPFPKKIKKKLVFLSKKKMKIKYQKLVWHFVVYDLLTQHARKIIFINFFLKNHS